MSENELHLTQDEMLVVIGEQHMAIRAFLKRIAQLEAALTVTTDAAREGDDRP